ncbi:ankyrin repeat-containing domain protein [Aspergillus welwitschiae]|uniref:Ankyrin repeat-containing domain protein n=1 Tax=Aspergillus welwitschiae TaxID=1341132 RepID=A0A3F3PH17_9EURO|nr:ankyrin repeat-containing domain protein [Aspergillus welwitschiae]RDH26117.1 ankyrin repeat-containing domain protein [Aspergillus welwitschiae]
MVNRLKKQQKSKEASKKIANVPVVLFISSNVEDRGRSPMKKLETFHCTLGDRFGRDREFYSTTKDEDGMTPLHYAARLLPTGSISWVEHEEERQKWNLLLKGFNQDDLNVQDEDGRTPLSHAAEVGSAWVVDKLIKTGADLYQCDQNGRSPLSWAAQSGERESSHSQEVGHLAWRKVFSSISVSTRVAADYISTSLLSTPTACGLTLLSRAVQLDRILIVAILLTIEDIDIGVPDGDGKTPLWRAIEAGNREITELLWNYDDVTLRLLATSAQARSDLLEWVANNRYPFTRRHGPDNQTAFHIMLDIPNIGVMEHHLIQFIIAQVPNLPTDTVEAPTYVSSEFREGSDRRGLTPLALAKEKRLLPIVKLFLRWRAGIDRLWELLDCILRWWSNALT